MRELASKRLGDFEILRELGRGGMGVVFEARQVSLHRKVALKVLSGGLGLTAKAVQRFHREAEAAAKLHHTNIVPVYATGEEEGTHFYAMELIDGPSLDQVIRQIRQARKGHPSPELTSHSEANAPRTPDLAATGPYAPEGGSLPTVSASSFSSDGGYFDTVARMVGEVADALDYAHRQGIIHRDVKPSNLLLSPAGRLSLNDFGLARLLEQPGMTMSGEFVGTPAYMSPEQIAVGRIPLDHRTDIYSLGATLYELLTMEPPHQGQSREQVLAQIVHKEPMVPRRIQKKVPVDLETICLKCLEKDPDRRYQTAGELAEDLRRYVNRFAISARRAGPVARLVKWVRRRPALAASLGCLFLAICVAVAFAYQAHRVEERARLMLLDEKVSHAYEIASSGDVKRTDDAIKEIEELGASTGQVRLLRGMVAYFRADAQNAINELEQAVKLLPDSVAARALLMMSYGDYGAAERCEQLIREMEYLSPSSPEDYLFKGYARQFQEMGEGLADLDEGIRRRNSPLGRALRAFVRTNRAIDSAKRQDAEEALVDAEVARGMLPDNQTVLSVSVFVRLVAAAIYQEAGLTDKRKAVLEEADRYVQALEPFIELPNPAWFMWQYFDEIGEPDKALEVARRSLKRSGSPAAAYMCVLSLYRQGKFIEASECLDQRRQAELTGDVARGFLLVELPDGHRRALDECAELARKYPQEFWDARLRGNLLMFLGRKEQALSTLRRFRPPFALSQDWKEFYEAMRQFGCGELSEEGYLAKAGPSRWRQCLAHFEIGLFRLADGNRASAGDHFSKVVKTRAWEIQWYWSLMFHNRLQNDPNWPPWLPAKP
jgi:tetratricopeptide (TPR) repeat protein